MISGILVCECMYICSSMNRGTWSDSSQTWNKYNLSSENKPSQCKTTLAFLGAVRVYIKNGLEKNKIDVECIVFVVTDLNGDSANILDSPNTPVGENCSGV